MSVQETIQKAMYQDIDDLTAIIRRMHLQRGVCRSDGIALEAHIALPSSIRQYTEAPSRTHYDRTLAIAKAKRSNLHHDLYTMESRAVLSRPDLPMTELCASMEAITGRHFLLFGGVLAMIAILLKFFGVDGGSGGGGGGGGGGAATAAAVNLENRMQQLEDTVAKARTSIQASPKPNASKPVLTAYSNKNGGAQPVDTTAPNHAAIVVAAEAVIKHIHAMFAGTDADDFAEVIKSPAAMHDFLLGVDGGKSAGSNILMARRFYAGKLVGLDGSNTWHTFISFGEDLSEWIDKRTAAIGDFLKSIADGVMHNSNEVMALIHTLGIVDVFPEKLLESEYPSSYNTAIAAAVTELKNADAELRIAITPARLIAWVTASSTLVKAANGKLVEIWFTPINESDGKKVEGIVTTEVVAALTAPVKELASNIDKIANRTQQLTHMQTQLAAADKQLAEQYEHHKDHMTDVQRADMAGIRYVNSTLSFAVGLMMRSAQYLHSKTTRMNNLSSYMGSYQAACISLMKLYDLL